MRTVLITGAAGFVGSHLVDRCLHDGCRVIGIDDFSSGLRLNLKIVGQSNNFIFLRQDLTKPLTPSISIAQLKRKGITSVDWVVHLAAEKIPRYGGRLRTLHVNVLGTFSALGLAKALHAKFLFASTSDVYGMTSAIPFREESSVVFGPSEVARWAYGSSKYLGEQLAYAFQEDYGISVVIARIFGVYGPRQVKGWKGNAVSSFFDQAMQKKSYELHGTGSQTRSFLYIDDLIAALLLALSKSWKNPVTMNIGSTETISMKDLATKIHQLMIKDEDVRFHRVAYRSFTGRPYQDIQKKIPNLRLAWKLLRWKPRVSLDEGLKRTAEWYNKQTS